MRSKQTKTHPAPFQLSTTPPVLQLCATSFKAVHQRQPSDGLRHRNGHRHDGSHTALQQTQISSAPVTERWRAHTTKVPEPVLDLV